MRSLVLSKADVLISGFISPTTARAQPIRVEQAIYDACAFIAESPMRGHARPDLTGRSLRFWTVTRYPNYTVVYRWETVPLQIVAVLQGKRNIRRILNQRP
jgi:plasmid stabilization system protein ParE